jgi:putative DNA primase/helicase
MGIPRNLLEMSNYESHQWPDPLPLTNESMSIPYPLDALHGIIGESVREAVKIVGCPVALAANSALSVLSVAGQGVANIHYTNQKGAVPLSLYLLSLADSGERKTSADSLFSEVLKAWARNKEEELADELKARIADIKSWNAELNGVQRAIEKASEKNEDTSLLKEKLRSLQQYEPSPVYVPSFVLDDFTQEVIGSKLTKKWPSAAMLSSEAGSFFGGHSMNGDSITRTLALLNKLWGAEEYTVDRRGGDSYTVRDARLTVGLSVQPAVIESFYAKNGALAKGSGFLARFLMAWPETTQGQRQLTEADILEKPKKTGLNLFYAKLHELLERQFINGHDGKLTGLQTLTLTREASKIWLAYYNDAETSIRAGGDMEHNKETASKSAENAARLAGLLHLFSGESGSLVSAEVMQSACTLASWYLYESRRFFGELALPENELLPMKLEKWLINYCRANSTTRVTRSEVLQKITPIALRKADALKAALIPLAQTHRVSMTTDGKANIININPKLLEVGHGA